MKCQKLFKQTLCIFLSVILIFFSVNNSYFSPHKMDNVEDAILLSKGRAKGSISGDIKKKPTEEWLNIFKLHDLNTINR